MGTKERFVIGWDMWMGSAMAGGVPFLDLDGVHECLPCNNSWSYTFVLRDGFISVLYFTVSIFLKLSFKG